MLLLELSAKVECFRVNVNLPSGCVAFPDEVESVFYGGWKNLNVYCVDGFFFNVFRFKHVS